MIEFLNIRLQVGGLELYSGLNLKIKERSKIQLAGKSGIGKTTLFRMLLGFNNNYSGEIRYKGERISAKSIWDIRKEVSYIPQNIQLNNEKIDVLLQNIFSFRVYRNIPDFREKFLELTSQFHLEKNIISKKWSELSGGEKQRVAIIISEIQDRNIVLLDEITSGLDNELKQKVVRHFISKSEKTIIIISHDKDWQKHGDVSVFNLENYQWE